MSSNRSVDEGVDAGDGRTGTEVGADRQDDGEAALDGSAADRADLKARNELLVEQNRQLREAYREARRARYRRTALGLFAVGVLGLVGAVAFLDIRTVLTALGGTDVFVGVLTYSLMPEQFIVVSVSGTVFDALAGNEAAVAEELGLTDVRVSVPTGDGARLFVPQFTEYGVPDDDALDSAFVIGDDEVTRGLALDPTGDGLYEAFDRGQSGPPPEAPIDVARQLGDAACGSLTDFDHPVPSLLAVGLARDMNDPGTVAVEPAADDRYESLIVCSWRQ